MPSPTHVVVDKRDGYVYYRVADGSLMNELTAVLFASKRNMEQLNANPPIEASYSAYELTRVLPRTETLEAVQEWVIGHGQRRTRNVVRWLARTITRK